MLVLGLILLILDALLPLPGIVSTIGIILVVVGALLLLLSFVAPQAIGGRRFY